MRDLKIAALIGASAIALGTGALSACDSGGGTLEGPKMVINEVVAEGTDWVELYNAGDQVAALAGWTLTDDNPDHIYTFGDEAALEAGAFMIISAGDAAEGGLGFGLGKQDAVNLYDGNTTLVDSISWNTTTLPSGHALGRIPDGAGDFESTNRPSPGAPNTPTVAADCGDGQVTPPEICDGADVGDATCRRLGMGLVSDAVACGDGCRSFDTTACAGPASDVRLNEMTSEGEDQIELVNAGAATVDIGGWRLSDCGGGLFNVAPGTTLRAGEYLVFTKVVHHDFGLGGSDCVSLADAAGVEVDFTEWSSRQALISWCRRPDAGGAFGSCEGPSFGAENP